MTTATVNLTFITPGQSHPTETMTESEALDLMRDLGFSAFETITRHPGYRNVLYRSPKAPGAVCHITFRN